MPKYRTIHRRTQWDRIGLYGDPEAESHPSEPRLFFHVEWETSRGLVKPGDQVWFPIDSHEAQHYLKRLKIAHITTSYNEDLVRELEAREKYKNRPPRSNPPRSGPGFGTGLIVGAILFGE